MPTSSHEYMPSPDPLHLPLHKRRTMEDVWKEIGLSSLDHQYTTSTSTEGNTNSTDNSRRPIILQEFLATPFRAQEDSFPTSHYCTENDIGFNLNTTRPSGDHQVPHALGLSYAPSTDPQVQLTVASDSASNKRIMNKATDFSGEQRRKRMMKNRESAARSRARKQAYTYELEMEVAQLMEENKRLKRQIQELCMAAASAQVPPTKQSLHRTSTAPF